MGDFLVATQLSIEMGYKRVDVVEARYLRERVESSDITKIAASITRKRIVGDGMHIDLINDTQEAEQAMRDITSVAVGRSGSDSGAGSDADSGYPPEEDSDDSDMETGASDLTPGQHLLRHAGKRRFVPKKRAGEAHDAISIDDIMAPVREEWKEFTETLDAEILRQGFSVLTRRRSLTQPDINVPHVLDIAQYDLYVRLSPLYGAQYVPVWANLNESQQKEVGARNGNIIRNAIVLVGPRDQAPLPTGALQSKLSAAAPIIIEHDALNENISYAVYWATHQPWVPELGNGAVGSRKGPATNAGSAPPYANYTQMLQNKEALARYARAQKLDDHEEHREDTFARHRRYQLERREEQIRALAVRTMHLGTNGMNGRDGNHRHILDPPYMNEYPMEPGDRIASGPVPTLPAQTREHKNDLARRAYLALDVQPQMVTLEHSNHAANADVAFSGQNEAIENRKQTLLPLLHRAFCFVYAIDLTWVDARLGAPTPSAVEHSGSAVRTRMFTADGVPSRVAHRIRVRLSGDPLATPSNLENMLKTAVIDHDAYKDLMLKQAYVPTHLASTRTVTPDEVDCWYGHGKPEASQPVGTKRSIDGKAKKRTAASAGVH